MTSRDLGRGSFMFERRSPGPRPVVGALITGVHVRPAVREGRDLSADRATRSMSSSACTIATESGACAITGSPGIDDHRSAVCRLAGRAADLRRART
jgi:hypothetical protein